MGPHYHRLVSGIFDDAVWEIITKETTVFVNRVTTVKALFLGKSNVKRINIDWLTDLDSQYPITILGFLFSQISFSPGRYSLFKKNEYFFEWIFGILFRIEFWIHRSQNAHCTYMNIKKTSRACRKGPKFGTHSELEAKSWKPPK